MDICGEIEYPGIHSDICIGHKVEEMVIDQERREFLHACLDEWLDLSKGMGGFWVGNADWVQEFNK